MTKSHSAVFDNSISKTGPAVEHQCKQVDCNACSNSTSQTNQMEHVQSTSKDEGNIKISNAMFNGIFSRLQHIKHEINQNLADIQTYRNNVRLAIKQQRHNINSMLDKLENELLYKIDTIQHEDEATVQSVSKLHATLTSDLQSLILKYENKQQSEQLLEGKDSLKHDIETLSMRLNDLTMQNTIHRYEFELSKDIENFIKSVQKFGTCATLNSSRMRKAAFSTDIDVKCSSDKTTCDVISVCNLSEYQIVAADIANCALKLIDISSNKVTSVVTMTSRPWGLTTMDDTRVAVTLPSKKAIQLLFVSYSDTLTKDRLISTTGTCTSIAYSRENFIVAYVPGKIEILDINGGVLQSFLSGPDEQRLFVEPYCIALSPNHDMIYVTDVGKHCVVVMALDGSLKITYNVCDDGLRHAWGLVVDKTDTVYVCGASSNDIYQFTADLTKVQVMIDSQYGLKNPQCLAYNNKNNKLFVGMFEKNVVKVYDIQ